VIVLNGDGYSLMWNEGEEIKRYDWQPGTLIVPPDRAFHQHFNVGNTPARYLALRFSGNTQAKIDYRKNLGLISVKQGGDQIEYEDQDPLVHSMFVDSCAQHGVDVKMDKFVSTPAAAS
jgi:hypothetical protein